MNGSKEPSSFSGVIGAFAYPVATDSGARLLGGALALTLMGYVARFGGFAVVVIPVGPVILVMAAILSMGLAGYLFEFVKNVVVTSAVGDERMPGWPEATSPAALVRPFLQLVTLVLFCFGPATLWVIRNPNWGGVWIPAGLAVVGVLYLPMALLAVSLSDSIGGLNPVLVVSSILRIPMRYLVACILIIGVMLLQFVSKWAFDLIPLLVVPTLLTRFAMLYLVVVSARVVGVMYYLNRDRLPRLEQSG